MKRQDETECRYAAKIRRDCFALDFSLPNPLSLAVIIDAYEQHISRCRVRIVGADRAGSFRLDIPTTNIEYILKVCKSVWKRPEEYVSYGLGDPYYDFLKYLWLEYGDNEYSLGSVAEGNITLAPMPERPVG